MNHIYIFQFSLNCAIIELYKNAFTMNTYTKFFKLKRLYIIKIYTIMNNV